MCYMAAVGVFLGVFSHCEASGSQSFLLSCAFHSADTIIIARALGWAFYTQIPRLSLDRYVHGIKLEKRCMI